MTEEKLKEVSSYYGEVLSCAAKTAFSVAAIASVIQGYYLVPCKRKSKDRSYISRCRHYKRILKKSDRYSFRWLFADMSLSTLRFCDCFHAPMRKVRIPQSHYINYSVLCLIHKKKGKKK